MTDRELIDKLIDWRRANRAWDTTPVKVNLGPKELNRALNLPKPLGTYPNGVVSYPTEVMWRGMKLQAKT